MVLVGRAGQCHAAVRGVVLHVPAPSTVVLYLEQPCQLHCFGFENGQGHIGAGGPGAGGYDLMALPWIDIGKFLADGRQQFAQTLTSPPSLGEPIETPFEQVPMFQTGFGAFIGICRNAKCAAPAGNRIEQHRLKPHIGDGHIGLHHRRALVNAVADSHFEIAIFIFQHDLQLAAIPSGVGLMAAIAQFSPDNGMRKFVTGNHVTCVGGHDLRNRSAFGKLHTDTINFKSAHNNRLAIRVFERHGHRARIPCEGLGHHYLHYSC